MKVLKGFQKRQKAPTGDSGFEMMEVAVISYAVS